jgi:hypothetical protein
MSQLGSEATTMEFEEWEPATASIVVLTTAELAECTCPEFCERDHDVD